MSTPNPQRTPDLSLTCRTRDLGRFAALGLTPVRSRGEVTDLELPRADRDSRSERSVLAGEGIPFYGYAATNDFYQVPVVFAADGVRLCEAPAGTGNHPAAHLYSHDGFPDGSELYLGRDYYRALAAALDLLPDLTPWLPSMPKKFVDAMACECGGRGWVLAREEATSLCFVTRCEVCSQFETDVLAGLMAYGPIEAGWPQ
jgi:hypothetical protein